MDLNVSTTFFTVSDKSFCLCKENPFTFLREIFLFTPHRAAALPAGKGYRKGLPPQSGAGGAPSVQGAVWRPHEGGQG